MKSIAYRFFCFVCKEGGRGGWKGDNAYSDRVVGSGIGEWGSGGMGLCGGMERKGGLWTSGRKKVRCMKVWDRDIEVGIAW